MITQKLHHSLFLFCHIVICVLLIKTSKNKTLGSYCQAIQHSIKQITNVCPVPTNCPVFVLRFFGGKKKSDIVTILKKPMILLVR